MAGDLQCVPHHYVRRQVGRPSEEDAPGVALSFVGAEAGRQP